MKKIILFLCLSCVYAYAIAQKVSNVVVKQVGNEMVITYTLEAPDDKLPFDVTLEVFDKGKLIFVPKTVLGDIGKNITRGSKKMVWKVTSDLKSLKGDNLFFEVKARYDDIKPTTTKNYEAIIKGLESNMVSIKAGKFKMGSPATEPERFDNETQKDVSVSAFQMGKYEVTQAEWEAVMGSKPSYFKDCPQCPVENISYDDIVNGFLPKLNKLTNKKYRLPTEEEWEYACRASTITPFSTGNNLTIAQGNYDGNYPYNNNTKGILREKTIKVGSFPANAFGLFDMHGNVWEWTSSLYEKNNSNRVVRGGSWVSDARTCRSAYRDNNTPNLRNFTNGFRLSL